MIKRTETTVLVAGLILALLALLVFATRLAAANKNLRQEVAALAALKVVCPALPDKAIADIEINRPDGTIVCSYYRPHGMTITKRTIRGSQ